MKLFRGSETKLRKTSKRILYIFLAINRIAGPHSFRFPPDKPQSIRSVLFSFPVRSQNASPPSLHPGFRSKVFGYKCYEAHNPPLLCRSPRQV